MSKKRGLSLEEKRTCVLAIFHETRDVFSLKDIEKLAPKKGVVLQSVKEVLQSLVDDDLVHQEKIGSSNYFWSFPSEAAVKIENNLQKLQARIKENQQTMQSLQQELEESRQSKEDSAEQAELVGVKAELDAKLAKQQCDLAQYADNDPERYQRLEEASIIAREAANRWLDNIDALRKWLKKRFEGQGEQLNSFFSEHGITEDMEYLA